MSLFVENVITIGGDQGREWLDLLPDYVDELAALWDLKDLTPVDNLTYNYVLKGYSQERGTPIVLKLVFESYVFEQEAAALVAYQGSGCVRLLATEKSYQALLLEQAVPGTSLISFFPDYDDRASYHTVAVMRRLHAVPLPQTHHFLHIADWLKDLTTDSPHLQGYHLEKAQAMAQDLLATSAPSVLLHGDLHHANIVAHGDSWMAIDPKGVIGEPAYEVGAFIRNPFPFILKQPDIAHLMACRLDMFAELLTIDRQRLKAWSYVQAVLADCWAAQHSDDHSQWLVEAKIIDEL